MPGNDGENPENKDQSLSGVPITPIRTDGEKKARSALALELSAIFSEYEKEIFSQTPQGEWFSKVIDSSSSFDLLRWISQDSE